jgi:hypothetical protein
MTVHQCSRRTIMDGEVVTFATDFRKEDDRFQAVGAFEISASRNAVMVHRAMLWLPEHLADFTHAINLAYATLHRLSKHTGSRSLFPTEPTEVPPPREKGTGNNPCG